MDRKFYRVGEAPGCPLLVSPLPMPFPFFRDSVYRRRFSAMIRGHICFDDSRGRGPCKLPANAIVGNVPGSKHLDVVHLAG